ncbi:MAG: metallophosphoesterase [Firmicutes bacterium]|nr:metallophosphoesterase [Bacillota bacterium]
MVAVVFILILFTYGLINFYIGWAGWNYIFKYIPYVSKGLYWLVFWFIAWSYLLDRLGKRFLPFGLENVVSWVGSYWIAAFFYIILFLVPIILVKVIDKKLHFLPEWLMNYSHKPHPVAIATVIIVIAIIIYGTWNARNPGIVRYDLTIPKKATVEELHLVMASDIHLGEIMDEKRLEKMVEMINELNPDLVLFAGDVIDSDASFFTERKITDIFLMLNPKYGVYTVLGNHEYINGHVNKTITNLEQSKVQVLRDDAIEIANSFYIIGRDDMSRNRFLEGSRKKLPELMKNVDKRMPIILLDHQPNNLDEAEKLGVDLQLSGHTHRGQMFPNNFITERIFEVDWGYLSKGDLQVIVSLGFGTWGPPIRVGNTPEIVDINIKFGG